MEIPVYTLILTGHILASWMMPVVLSGCKQDARNLDFPTTQKIWTLMIEKQIFCKDLREGKTDECSDECDDRVRQILENFTTFFTCDCSDLGDLEFYPEDQCVTDRERLGVCSTLRNIAALTVVTTTQQTSTTPTILEGGKIPCDRAHLHCQEDRDCMVLLETTTNACTGGCSKDCQRKVDALLSLRHAQSLWGCTGCRDGDEGRWCQWSNLCMNMVTLESYKPGEEQSSTEKTTGTKGGSVRQSGRGGGSNGASSPHHGAVFVSSMGLYILICVGLSALFVE